MAMREDTILADFNRYHEVCRRENEILMKGIKGETYDVIKKNAEQGRLGGRPKGVRAWSKAQEKRP